MNCQLYVQGALLAIWQGALLALLECVEKVWKDNNKRLSYCTLKLHI